jgi:hypothetical protein
MICVAFDYQNAQETKLVVIMVTAIPGYGCCPGSPVKPGDQYVDVYELIESVCVSLVSGVSQGLSWVCCAIPIGLEISFC